MDFFFAIISELWKYPQISAEISQKTEIRVENFAEIFWPKTLGYSHNILVSGEMHTIFLFDNMNHSR